MLTPNCRINAVKLVVLAHRKYHSELIIHLSRDKTLRTEETAVPINGGKSQKISAGTGCFHRPHPTNPYSAALALGLFGWVCQLA
jgi:hypothetical protein